MLKFRYNVFYQDRPVGFHCLFGMESYSFLATPVLSKCPKTEQPLNGSTGSFHAISSCSLPLFSLAQLCCYFGSKEQMQMLTLQQALSFHPCPLGHLSMLSIHEEKMQSKRSLASLRLVMDKKSKVPGGWHGAGRVCPLCWPGAELWGMDRAAGVGRVGNGEANISSTRGSSEIWPCCEEPRGESWLLVSCNCRGKVVAVMWHSAGL